LFQVTTQEDRFLLYNKVLDGPGGAAFLPVEDVGGGNGDEDQDDALSVASSASSISSLASELSGPSTSKAKKMKVVSKKGNLRKKKTIDKRKNKKAGVARIVCYASNFGLSLLRKAECWSSDGTFSVCPEPFYQFYSVHAHLGQNAYPAAFIFMPGKRRIHYHVSIWQLFV
jgi:hypothetical protein